MVTGNIVYDMDLQNVCMDYHLRNVEMIVGIRIPTPPSSRIIVATSEIPACHLLLEFTKMCLTCCLALLYNI